MVQRCLEKGADVNAKNNYGKIPLDLAGERRYMEIVDILNSAKRRRFYPMQFYTPLHNAVRDGDLEVVKQFVNKNNDVVNSCSCGYTLSHVAAIYGRLKIIQFLLDERANIHAKDPIFGEKPIHSAAASGRENIVKFFLGKREVSINDTDNGGRTPLHLAAMYGHLETVKLLVGKGANIHARSNFNYKPVHHAITNGYENIVKFFIDIGIDINDADRDGWTLLHYAADCGQSKIVRTCS